MEASKTLIAMPDTREIESQRNTLTTLAESMTVDTPAAYASAGSLHNDLMVLEKDIHERTDEPVALAHKTHKAIKALQNDLLGPVTTARKKVKQLMAGYDAEQERLRREEEARLQKEADKQAEEAALRAAEAAEAAGDSEVAEAILEAPVAAPPVILPSSTPKTGVSFREVWKFRVTDEKLIPRQYMMPDEKKIGGVVRAMKDGTQIPGIEVYSERV